MCLILNGCYSHLNDTNRPAPVFIRCSFVRLGVSHLDLDHRINYRYELSLRSILTTMECGERLTLIISLIQPLAEEDSI